MQFVLFALLGLGSGAVYAMLAQGLVLIYRGSGILNFAQGAMAMAGGCIYLQVSVRNGAPLWVGLVVAVLGCGVLGSLIHLFILRPMRGTSPLSRVIATLGILLTFQSLAFLLYGQTPLPVPSTLPISVVHVFSNSLPVGIDLIAIFAIGLILTVVLTVFYGHTSFGRVTAAVAQDEVVAATLGHSPDVVAAINWALGSALAGLAGVLIVPIIYLDPITLVLLIIPAMSAALIGEFSSFPLTFGVAVLFGVANSEITRYVSEPGWSTAVPFLAIVLTLVIRGRVLPLRSFVLDRLPTVGSGRIRPVPVLVLFAIGTWLVLSLGSQWTVPIITTLGAAIICLSVVVLTGYAGQLSLAQATLAGTGALLAARFVTHMPFLLALALGAVATAAVGSIFGVPALRTRGVTLAIVTLGLGGSLSYVLLDNISYTGGVSGISVPVPTVFGWDINPLTHSNRYAFVVLVILVLLCLAVANLRRGITGRRLLAVRSNERAAAALGVNVAGVKLYAFTLASGIASVGGILLAFGQSSIELSGPGVPFDVFTSILIVAAVVFGGVGSPGGAILGSLLISGGIVTELFSSASSINEYLPLVGGILLILTLIFSPDGIIEACRVHFSRALVRFSRRSTLSSSDRPLQSIQSPVEAAQYLPIRVDPLVLAVSELSVNFGGVQALTGISLDIQPGEVHGIIGPNGAGKTTLIDAITGFVGISRGSVVLGDSDVSNWSARTRAAAGISRSFQSLELFEDLSIAENLAVASNRGGLGRYLSDFFHPGRVRLGPAALEVIRRFELTESVGKKPQEVSFGQRKTVAIARAVASAPSILLLDEPAAGLDDHETSELAQLIRALAREWGIGVLLVEHNVSLIMTTSDRVTVLANGSVLKSGTPAEIASDPDVHSAYLGDPGAESRVPALVDSGARPSQASNGD